MNRYQNILNSYGNDYLKAKTELNFNEKNSQFGHVPSPLWVEDILIEFYKGGSKLLDIGCGLGNILKLTNEIGYETTGIEINEDLSKHHRGLNVIYDDVIHMDLSFIEKFDIIYTYRILKSESTCNELFNKIYNNMKDDATIIYIYPHDFNFCGLSDKERLTGNFHITKSTKQDEYYSILRKN